ncbi:hypothetical protein MPF19_11295 [Polaribacter sp. Z014]|uniref:VPS10 domain-containing protein n=1 Tax=Polaribacter sp. Z014 TaxID=2927126 RepID=UPI002021D84F|nr:hypothetical protein [Polaribacter sp. Z014]MCL7764004.1 hypothetical protein [Polaribacter sp. Z014]
MKKLILLVSVLIFACKSESDSQFFDKIKNTKIASDQNVEWKNFGPGMSGYNEAFWSHPTDPNVMFLGPDMHVAYGTWDNGKSWQSIKDPDGLGLEMKRVLDIEFSMQNPDFGMALDWNGWVYETADRGRSWQKTKELGKSYKEVGIDPNDLNSFKKGWYYEQEGTRHSELAVDPTNENIWYVGAGDFWNVKNNVRTRANPYGTTFKYASYGYIYKSTDKGKSWKKISKGLPKNTDVGRIIVDPNNNNTVVMAANMGLFHSFDGGLSWNIIAKGLPNNIPRDLTSYYNKDTKEFVLYLVEQTMYEPKGKSISTKGGVYKSIDTGKNWTSITGDLGVDFNEINDQSHRNNYYKALSIFLEEDSKKLYPIIPKNTYSAFNKIVVNPTNKDEIYLVANQRHDRSFGPGDAWKTENGGKTWVICARSGEYWLNKKDENYWKEKGNPIGANVEFSHVSRSYEEMSETRFGNRVLGINSIGDVFIEVGQQTQRSTDGGATWKQIDDFETSKGSGKWIGRGDSNLPGRFMLHETGIKERRLLCSGEHGLWQTTDLDGWPDKQAVAVEQIEGQNNDHGGKHGAHSISTVAVHPKDPNTIYILAWRQEHRGKLRKTTDGGKTWKNISTIFEAANAEYRNLAPQNSLLIDPVNPDNMYFCSTTVKIAEISGSPAEKLTKGGYGFYRSSDGGYTWELSNNGFHKDASVRRIVMDLDNPETLYAALNDDNGGLYKSTNKGSDWERVTIPSVIKSVNSVFIDRNTKDILISTGRRTGTYEEGGVWRSKNEGKSWKRIFKAPYVWQAETSPVNSKLIVISVPGQIVSKAHEFMNPGIYLSKDDGENWTKINKGLGNQDKMTDIKPDPYNENVIWSAAWGSGWYVAYLNGSTDGWLKE